MPEPVDKIRLTDLKSGEKGTIVEILGGPALKSRLSAMGIFEGKEIVKVSGHFLGGPVILGLGKTRIALGSGMAGKIAVEKIK